jgi:hypothetical protein
MLIPLLLVPIWLVCVVAKLLTSSESRSGHYALYCSTAILLAITAIEFALRLWLAMTCFSDSPERNYSCMHAAIFWGLFGDLAGLFIGIAIGARLARRSIERVSAQRY